MDSLKAGGVYILLVASMALPGRAQTPPPRAANDPAIEIMNEVAGVDADLAAYFLLLQARQMSDPAVKLKLLNQALEYSGYAAPYPVHLNGGNRASTAAIIMSNVMAPPTDRMSLQLRMVPELAKIDPKRARSVLFEVVPPAPPRQTCQAAFVPDFLATYPTISRLLNDEALVSNRDRGLSAAAYLFQVFSNAISSLQFAGLTEILMKTQMPASVQRSLVATLALSLKTNSDYDPTFTAAVFDDGLAFRMTTLIRTLVEKGMPVTELLRDYGGYLDKNRAVGRCIYARSLERQLTMVPQFDYVGEFNSLVEELTRKGMLTPGEVSKLGAIIPKMADAPARGESLDVFSSPEAKALELLVVSLAMEKEGGDATELDRLPRSASVRQEDIVVALENYALKAEKERDRPPEATLIEVGYVCKMLLRWVTDPDLYRRATEVYARTIGATWRPAGLNQSFSFACLRELVRGCWPAEAGTNEKELAAARWQGIEDGLRSQDPQLLNVARLTQRLDAGRCDSNIPTQ